MQFFRLAVTFLIGGLMAIAPSLSFTYFAILAVSYLFAFAMTCEQFTDSEEEIRRKAVFRRIFGFTSIAYGILLILLQAQKIKIEIFPVGELSAHAVWWPVAVLVIGVIAYKFDALSRAWENF